MQKKVINQMKKKVALKYGNIMNAIYSNAKKVLNHMISWNY